MEEVVGNLQRANTVLLEAQGAIRGSGSSLQFIQERVNEVSDARCFPVRILCPAHCSIETSLLGRVLQQRSWEVGSGEGFAVKVSSF